MFLARLKEDINTIMAHDPAARSRLEVVLCYPGVHAVMAYRVAHWLWERKFTTLARFVSHFAKVFTGIEIHPGATLGRRLFIDHGTGVVIGETAEVGDDCTLYQGVTLGGTSLEGGKRHPTLGHGVIVGSGAQILGPHNIGAGARVGANAVVLSDVAPGTTVVGIPAKAVLKGDSHRQEEEFCAYGVPREELPDPVLRAMDTMSAQVCALANRVNELEDRLAAEQERQRVQVAGAKPRVVVDQGADQGPDGGADGPTEGAGARAAGGGQG